MSGREGEWGKWHCACTQPGASDVEYVEEEEDRKERYAEEEKYEEGEEVEEEGDMQDEGFWSPALWMRTQQQPKNISPEIAALDTGRDKADEKSFVPREVRYHLLNY